LSIGGRIDEGSASVEALSRPFDSLRSLRQGNNELRAEILSNSEPCRRRSQDLPQEVNENIVPVTRKKLGEAHADDKIATNYLDCFGTGTLEMAYWRMQLHPAQPGESVKHCIESLAAGYIGLDFESDVGDLMATTKDKLKNQKDYWPFAHAMKMGDKVLIIAHHFPFALVTISGEYNYIRSFAQEIGVWFRHFRAVADVHYYADLETDVRKWEQLQMKNTISPLHDPSKRSYKLIEYWLGRLAKNPAS
jgi:hypothetical protein